MKNKFFKNSFFCLFWWDQNSFSFDIYISIKLYSVKLNITTIPPKNVSCEIVSFKNKESKYIIEGLQKIKGIGIWSASIFALFYLNHPDIFAWGDVSLKKAIRLLYEDVEVIEHERVIEITSKWTPYRSTACIVLWKWLDEGAVKFSWSRIND